MHGHLNDVVDEDNAGAPPEELIEPESSEPLVQEAIAAQMKDLEDHERSELK